MKYLNHKLQNPNKLQNSNPKRCAGFSQSVSLRYELRFATLDPMTHRGLIHVWIIGAWRLDIICFLLFGAWDLVYAKRPLF